MPYDKSVWKDHIVEKPNHFISKEIDENGNVVNQSTIELERQEGEILQQGTPISATNLQKIEDELARVSVLADQHQSRIDNHENRLGLIEATFQDSFTSNQFTEDLTTLNFIKLSNGYYNEAQSQLEV